MDIEECAAEEADRAVYTFTFVDTGIGINPEFVDKIFDAFPVSMTAEWNRLKAPVLEWL